MYDLIIVGAGPAGITASVYACRKRMNLLVISKDIGGQTALTGDIENYTGYQFISGRELTAKFQEHLKNYGIVLRENEEIKEIQRQEGLILVKSDQGEYRTRTVIIASGKTSKELAVPGEREFKNRGLSYCATCDGPLFSGKDVAVVGGGNSALDAALQLIKIAKRIYLINVAENLSGDAIMEEKVRASGKVTILNKTRVSAILGDKFVQAIKVKTGQEEKTLSVQGVFVEIGLIPNSGFVSKLDKNEKGEIKVNCSNETNISGVFAAGDVTDVPEKQVIIAAGEGAKAALSAFRYLSQIK